MKALTIAALGAIMILVAAFPSIFSESRPTVTYLVETQHQGHVTKISFSASIPRDGPDLAEYHKAINEISESIKGVTTKASIDTIWFYTDINPRHGLIAEQTIMILSAHFPRYQFKQGYYNRSPFMREERDPGLRKAQEPGRNFPGSLLLFLIIFRISQLIKPFASPCQLRFQILNCIWRKLFMP